MIEMNKPLCQLTEAELKDIVECAERELKIRKTARRDELIQTVCNAMNTLYQEYPDIELNIPYHCSECGIEDEIDAMYILCNGREMKPRDFYVW